MPVEIIDTRGQDSGQDKLKAVIEALEKKGTIGAIIPFQDSILVHWTRLKTERRG